MRALRTDQMALDFSPVSAKTRQTIELLDEVVRSLGLAVLKRVDVSLGQDVENPDAGRRGMSADQVLRMALVKQMYGFSYRELQVRVEDSILLRKFAGYEFRLVPSHSTLQDNIKAIDAETWEAISTALVKVAIKRGIDSGEKVRIDTTAVETLIHHPTDSSLLWDGVRVLTRTMEEVRVRFAKIRFEFHDRTRACKKLLFTISNAKSTEAAKADYRAMVAYAEEVLGYANGAVKAIRLAVREKAQPVETSAWAVEIERYAELLRKVIDQTKRRVFKGEKVPAEEKIVSIFEDHTDIIEKGGRETEFGHKVCLTIGASTLILDCQILNGNPADSEIFIDALESQIKKYRTIPSAVATDKGFGSADNAKAAIALGVKDLTFSKRPLAAEAQGLLANGTTERLLMRFRAGAEAVISAAKRGVNLARCLWRGWEGYCSYVWSAIAAHNLKMIVAALR
jgi:IS5 family transposase